MFRRALKAFLSGIATTATTLGLDYNDPNWWGSVAAGIITGFVAYWAKNKPGTLLHKPVEQPTTD